MTEKHHGYTNHGHPIPGACGIAGQRPKYVARCGGPRLCGTCSLDAERYNESRPDSNEPPTMTDQTLTTEEVQSAATQCPDGITPAEWDAWLTTHDRAVKAEAKAEALREVAAILRQQPSTPGERGLAGWLDNRAYRIEAGDE